CTRSRRIRRCRRNTTRGRGGRLNSSPLVLEFGGRLWKAVLLDQLAVTGGAKEVLRFLDLLFDPFARTWAELAREIDHGAHRAPTAAAGAEHTDVVNLLEGGVEHDRVAAPLGGGAGERLVVGGLPGEVDVRRVRVDPLGRELRGGLEAAFGGR